jgi:hypothetical protein
LQDGSLLRLLGGLLDGLLDEFLEGLLDGLLEGLKSWVAGREGLLFYGKLNGFFGGLLVGGFKSFLVCFL